MPLYFLPYLCSQMAFASMFQLWREPFAQTAFGQQPSGDCEILPIIGVARLLED